MPTRGPKPKRRDLLEEYSREVAFALIVLGVLFFALSAEATETVHLPGIAFGWKLGLDVVRAAVALAVVAIVVMVIVRGWGGMWPSSVSAQGLVYKELTQTTADLTKDTVELNEVLAEIRNMREMLRG